MADDNNRLPEDARVRTEDEDTPDDGPRRRWAGRAMSPDQFPATFKARMVAAYPVVAQMTTDEAYFATADERDEAFARILANRHLTVTCRLFLEAEAVGDDHA